MTKARIKRPSYKHMDIYTRADTGGGLGDCPPPEQFQGGDCPPPWELSPAWAIQGGDSQNVPPLSDSGGGQRFFSWYFLVNSFNKWCKIFGECNFRGGTVPPLSPPWGAQGGDKKFFGRFAPDLSPPWAKSCIRHCSGISYRTLILTFFNFVLFSRYMLI